MLPSSQTVYYPSRSSASVVVRGVGDELLHLGVVCLHWQRRMFDMCLDIVASCCATANTLHDAAASFLEIIKSCGAPYTRVITGPLWMLQSWNIDQIKAIIRW